MVVSARPFALDLEACAATGAREDLIYVSPKSAQAVSREALVRQSGARGLRAILEHAMLDIMYDIPSRSGIKEVVINDDVITKREPPLIVYQKEAELA